MVCYSSFSPDIPVEYRCAICLNDDFSTNLDTVAHDGTRSIHPIHGECIIGWLQDHNTCPICRAQVDTRSIMDWKQRCGSEPTSLASDAALSLISSTVGVCGGIGLSAILGYSPLSALEPLDYIVDGTVVLAVAGISLVALRVLKKYME